MSQKQHVFRFSCRSGQRFNHLSWQDLFFAFHSAWANNDRKALRGICAEPLARSVESGLQDSIDRHSAIHGVNVLSIQEDCEVVRYGLYYDTPTSMRTVTTAPSFAQVTVRILSKQAPITVPVEGQVKGRKKLRSAATIAQEGTWSAVLDKPTGHIYYHHSSTGAVQWDPPPQWGTVSTAPFRIEEAATERLPLEEPLPLGALGLEDQETNASARDSGFLQALNFVVFERAVLTKRVGVRDNAETNPWRILAL